MLLASCQSDGQALYFASKELRDDKNVVLAAVKNKPLILKYASLRLRQDKEVVLTALEKGKKKIADFIVPELADDEDVKKMLE